MVRSAGLVAVALLSAGCAETRLCHAPPAALPEADYRLGCGDVLDLTFADQPGWDAVASVGLDGHLPLGPLGSVPADGRTVAEVHLAVATAAGTDPDRVALALTEARAGRVYLAGPENDTFRAVPYRGPEPAVQFLWRVGAVAPGCSDLRAVTVTRPNVAVGGNPEVIPVDVAAVVRDGDHPSNVRLRSGDTVVIGETWRSWFARRLPDWFTPTYRAMTGLAAARPLEPAGGGR